jgi:hypothetical protein
MRVSYSFLSDERNPFHLHKDTLLRLILTDPRLRGIFHYIDKNNRVIWKPGPCFAYMQVAHEVEMKLFSATQTTVGEGGRGVEVANHLFRNAAGGSTRNVFNLFQFLILMGTYNKTSSLTEREDNMIRVPLPEIGHLWIMYLTYVRPLIAVWQRHFNGPKAAHRVGHSLFAGPHRPVTASELSQNLSVHTERILGIKISISRWRHIVTWFMNHHCGRLQAYLTLSGQSVLARQMGHDMHTHGLYSADSRLPGCMDFHKVFQTMLSSAVWHEILGFNPTLLNAMTHVHPGLSELRRVNDPRLTVTNRNTSALPTAKEIAIEVTKFITPELDRICTHSRANDLASFLDVMEVDVRTPISRPLPQLSSYIAHSSRVGALRRFLKDENATFKHPQQALAVEFMANSNSSLLIIAPTGKYIVQY